jgi:hypothetical protein
MGPSAMFGSRIHVDHSVAGSFRSITTLTTRATVALSYYRAISESFVSPLMKQFALCLELHGRLAGCLSDAPVPS